MADVRVRLTAEGVQEVVAALHKVGSEAAKAQQKAAQGAQQFGGALNGLKGTLASLGLAVSAGALLNFVRASSEAVEAVGKMAQVVGSSVTNLSALNLAATQNNISVDDLGTSLARFAKIATQAQGGIGQAVKGFAAIGVGREQLAQFKNLDTVEKLDMVAKAFARIPDGTAKSAAAIELFGRAGARLIPLLNDLGTKGLATLRLEAEDLGVLMSDDMVAAVESVNDAMDRLALKSQVTAAVFVQGASSPITRAINVLNLAVKQSTGGMKSFGEVTGAVFAGIIVGIVDFVDNMGTAAKIVGDVVGGIVKIIRAHLRLSNKTVKQEVAALNTLIEKDVAQRDARILARRIELAKETTAAAKTGNDETLVDLDEFYKQSAAIETAALEAALKTKQAALKLADQQQVSAYERGLTDVAAYYAKRIDLVNAGVQAEITSINKRLAIEATNPDANEAAKNIAKLHASIQQVRDEGAAQVAKLNTDRLKEQDRLTNAALAAEHEVMRAKGLGHQVAMAQLEQQLAEQDKVLRQRGVPREQRETVKTDARTALGDVLKFEAATDRAAASFARFDAGVAAINQRVAHGLMSQVAAEKELIALERSRVRDLRATADALLRTAKTPEQRQKASGFDAQVRNMELALKAADGFATSFKATLQDSLRSTIADFFGDGINQATSFADAMRGMAQSVISSLQRMAAQYLATKFIMALLPGGASASLDTGPIAMQNTLPLTPITRASGGIVHGAPGIDENLAWLTDQEFVVRAGVVKRPGVLAHLEQLNQGLLSPMALAGARGYAVGGLVGSAAQSRTSRLEGSMTVGLEPGLVMRELNSAAGRDAVLRIVARHPRSMRGAMGV